MKFKELAFDKTLGFVPEVEEIAHGLKITDRQFTFNNSLYNCTVIIDDENVKSIMINYTKVPNLPVKTFIKLTDVENNDKVKRYFENVLLKLGVSIDLAQRQFKVKDTLERIENLGGILKITDGKVYFKIEALDLKIKLNENNGWDLVYLNSRLNSSHDTLSQAVLIAVDNIKKEGGLLPNII